MKEQQLTELMDSYQKGEITAFEGLYHGLRPRLRHYLAMLSRGQTPVDDLLQETFLQMHRSRRTYLPGRAVLPWAFAIARHVYLMDLRKKSRIQRKEFAPGDTLPEIPVPPEVEGLANRLQLKKALAQLPPGQVEALTLHHVWGFSFEEIGAALGILPVTAKVRSYRGMRRLKEILEAGL